MKKTFLLKKITKKAKTDDNTSPLSSPKLDKNNMELDEKNENEYPLSSEPDISSRNNPNDIHKTPIIEGQDTMDTDEHLNKDIAQGSTNTQTISNANNDVNTRNFDIFKEHTSCSDSEFI
ncbi:hypothetical protein RhiirC2_718998 [Rhizophagus irregularis]|uniref:Uncharacterized protein n=1 Tax=Rhizophagus irregularis TaxID=588596 RepID=A0A2N1MG23_9GLOM|nr:hypothetical protein RhiirC2_718998 [Rhizophagus irregularis]